MVRLVKAGAPILVDMQYAVKNGAKHAAQYDGTDDAADDNACDHSGCQLERPAF